MANSKRPLTLHGKSRSVLNSVLALCFSLTAAAALVGGCAPEVIPTDIEVVKAYLDNHSDFERVTQVILAEPNQDFTVMRRGSPSYGASSSPSVSQKAINACHQIMARTFCLAVLRKGGTIYYLFHEHDGHDFFRRKALVYDQGSFTAPNWTPKADEASNLRYAPVGLPGEAGMEPNEHWKIEYRYEKR